MLKYERREGISGVRTLLFLEFLYRVRDSCLFFGSFLLFDSFAFLCVYFAFAASSLALF